MSEAGARAGDALTYERAGVDLDEAARAKARLAELVATTRTAAVASAFGSFGGRFRSTAGRDLVASADGVGTKLKIAFRSGRHDSVGIDLVNHCVNDILTEGARPLVFLDYIACGRLDADTVVAVVDGLAAACRDNGCALLGGETAEMPDFYATGEYDLAGFIVGEVAYPDVAAREVAEGDVLLGLAASGFHTNGYSLVRKVVFERLGLDVLDRFPDSERAVVDVLLEPHRTYLPLLRPSLEAGRVRALAHITGGGIPGNLGRVLPERLDAVVRLEAWSPPAEFEVIARASRAPRQELYRTFNMGIGMIAIVRPDAAQTVSADVTAAGCEVFPCGEIVAGRGLVRLEGP